MFLKASHALRLMLLALVAQIGNLAKIGIRKEYDDKHENQQKLREVEKDLKQESKWKFNDRSRLALADLSNYSLGLTGKFEPDSDLPTIDLYHNASRYGKFCAWMGCG